MSPEHLRMIGAVVAVLLGAVALHPVGTWFARRALERWARQEGYELVAFKTIPFWKGPRAWLRTENQEDYFVVVENRKGERRMGWVLFSWPWHGLGGKRTEIRWEDEWTPVEQRTLLDGEPL
jgi:hypothetical protein